jgi:hypothetical protein
VTITRRPEARATPQRLGEVEPARILYNSRNTPLFTLCFAVANEKGKAVALRIAKHILEHA